MIDWLIDHLAVIMFVALVFIMFLGYPVAFLLGAIGIGFCLRRLQRRAGGGDRGNRGVRSIAGRRRG